MSRLINWAGAGFQQVRIGMTYAQVQALLGPAIRHGQQRQSLHWPAGIKDVTSPSSMVAFPLKRQVILPQRQQFANGAPRFSDDRAGVEQRHYAGMDVWVIPRTSRHKGRHSNSSRSHRQHKSRNELPALQSLALAEEASNIAQSSESVCGCV